MLIVWMSAFLWYLDFLNLSTVLDCHWDLINLLLRWLDVAISSMLTISFLAHGTPFQLYTFQPILICKNLNAISITIYAYPDYSLRLLVIIIVSVSNSSTSCNPLCFSGMTALIGVIPIKKKNKTHSDDFYQNQRF